MEPEDNEQRKSECERGENVHCLSAPFVQIRNLKYKKQVLYEKRKDTKFSAVRLYCGSSDRMV
jgi:hypothetical protein